MADYFMTLEKALRDPELRGVRCIVPEHKEAVTNALREFPDARYVSEWRYEVGDITYRYHVHKDEALGAELKRLLQQDKTSRHPKLTDVFAISEIETILATQVPAGSH